MQRERILAGFGRLQEAVTMTGFSGQSKKTIFLNGVSNFKYSIVKPQNTSSGLAQRPRRRLQTAALGSPVLANGHSGLGPRVYAGCFLCSNLTFHGLYEEGRIRAILKMKKRKPTHLNDLVISGY